jgi:hypothetical protein
LGAPNALAGVALMTGYSRWKDMVTELLAKATQVAIARDTIPSCEISNDRRVPPNSGEVSYV